MRVPAHSKLSMLDHTLKTAFYSGEQSLVTSLWKTRLSYHMMGRVYVMPLNVIACRAGRQLP